MAVKGQIHQYVQVFQYFCRSDLLNTPQVEEVSGKEKIAIHLRLFNNFPPFMNVLYLADFCRIDSLIQYFHAQRCQKNQALHCRLPASCLARVTALERQFKVRYLN